MVSGRRLFAIDVDGTLLRTDKTLSPATVAAVRARTAAGDHVCIASSRPPHGLVDHLRALGLLEPVEFVAYQGGWVGSTDGSGSRSRVRHPLPMAAAEEVWARAIAAGLTANWHADDDWWVSRVDAAVEREAAIIGAEPIVRTADRPLPAPDKILLMGATAALDAFAAASPDAVDTALSAPHLLEITAPGVDKAMGVAAVAAARGLRAADVIAIGDGFNDLALFAWAGRSVAMANAPAEVRAAADGVTASNDDDGVAAVLDAAG